MPFLNIKIHELYLANISFISMHSPVWALLSKFFTKCSPTSFKTGNICFIFPEVKVGVNFTRKFRHFFPDNKNKCPDSGSIFSLQNIPRSWKLANSFVIIVRIRSRSAITRFGLKNVYIPKIR